MCKWGNDIILKVFIPSHLSHTGEGRWDYKGIDACIAPIVDALNNAGILTIQSCCGHGSGVGRIDLLDGRVLIIKERMSGCSCLNQRKEVTYMSDADDAAKQAQVERAKRLRSQIAGMAGDDKPQNARDFVEKRMRDLDIGSVSPLENRETEEGDKKGKE